MTAAEVFDAIREKYPEAALVPELTIRSELHDKSAWCRRIDALMFDNLQRTAIEIKVSRADVKRESFEKVYPWRRVTHRFVYAVPAGLIEKPPFWGPGLWWVHDDGKVEVVRKCQVNRYPEPLPQLVVQNIAFRAAGLPVPVEEGGERG